MRAYIRVTKIPLHLRVTGVVLFLLGIAKILGYANHDPSRIDPVFYFPERPLLLIQGAIETGIGIVILFKLQPFYAHQVCIGLGLCFLSYRWIYSAYGNTSQCPCLGAAYSWFPFLAYFDQNLLSSIAVWLCLIGLFGLLKDIFRV